MLQPGQFSDPAKVLIFAPLCSGNRPSRNRKKPARYQDDNDGNGSDFEDDISSDDKESFDEDDKEEDEEEDDDPLDECLKARRWKYGEEILQDEDYCGAWENCHELDEMLDVENSAQCGICHFYCHKPCLFSVEKLTNYFVCRGCVQNFSFQWHKEMEVLKYSERMHKRFKMLPTLAKTKLVSQELYDNAMYLIFFSADAGASVEFLSSAAPFSNNPFEGPSSNTLKCFFTACKASSPPILLHV